MSKKHFIIVGRTSKAIAQGILPAFGDGNAEDGTPIINRPGRVIQSRFGTFKDGEAIFELFVDGKLDDHPIEQHLSVEEKADILADLEGADVTIVHSLSGENTSSRAFGLLFGARYLKSHGVNNIKLIAPHLPFMRNDREFSKDQISEDGQSVTARQYNAVACDDYAFLLKTAGIDKVVGFEPHSRDGVKIYRKHFDHAGPWQIRSLINGLRQLFNQTAENDNNATFVNMGSFFAQNIAAEHPLINDGQCHVIVGSPDGMNKPNDYGMQRAYSFAEKLYEGTHYKTWASKHNVKENPCMFGISKKRINASETQIIGFHGNVAGKTCVIIDDIISGGSTTLHAAEKLKEEGAAHVIAVATHAVLTEGALPKLLGSPFLDKVMLTDTIPGALDKLDHVTHEAKSKLVIATISPLVNEQIALDIPRNQPEMTANSVPTLQAG